MQFLTSPPEVTSALVHSGPGARSLLEASGAWRQLGVTLDETADDYGAALSTLVGAWHGRSAASMVQAAEPYLAWLRTAAQQCQRTASSAQAAASAFESVRAAVVPTAQVTANRTRRVQLLVSNRFGNNLAAIAENENQYQSMWTNNSAAMSRYQAASTQAGTLPAFSAPSTVTAPTATATQAGAVSVAVAAAAPTLTETTSVGSTLASSLPTVDPNAGWFGLANTYANQFVSSGFPINLLSYLAQNTSAQALQNVNQAIGQGISEGEAALVPSAVGSMGALGGALGAAGLSATPTAAVGVGVSLGPLTAPPAVAGLLPTVQTPVQLASSVTPLTAGESTFPMLPPIMPPPISAGSGWRRRKQMKYDDLEVGLELRGPVMPRPPSAG